MHVSKGFPHMLTSNQRGRGQEPVTVVGNSRSAVTVRTWVVGGLRRRNAIRPAQPGAAADGRVPGSFHCPQESIMPLISQASSQAGKPDPWAEPWDSNSTWHSPGLGIT